MATKQGSQSSINIKNPDRTELESITYIRFVNRNLMAKNETGIGAVLSDGSDFQLRLHFTLQPDIDVVNHFLAHQMPSPRNLSARQPHWRCTLVLLGTQTERRSRRAQRRRRRRRGGERDSRRRQIGRFLVAQEGHQASTTV